MTDPEVRETSKIRIDLQTVRAVKIIKRLDVLSDDFVSGLQKKAEVKLAQQSPWTLTLTVDQCDLKCDLIFPVPVNTASCKVRIARKSSYIEIEVPTSRLENSEGHVLKIDFLDSQTDRNCIAVADVAATSDEIATTPGDLVIESQISGMDRLPIVGSSLMAYCTYCLA